MTLNQVLETLTPHSAVPPRGVARVGGGGVELHVAIAARKTTKGLVRSGHLLAVVDVGVPLIHHVGCNENGNLTDEFHFLIKTFRFFCL